MKIYHCELVRHEIREAGLPWPTLELLLVIALLLVGITTLLWGRRYLDVSFFLFWHFFKFRRQFFFETTYNERLDSVSAWGGVLAVAVMTPMMIQQQQQRHRHHHHHHEQQQIQLLADNGQEHEDNNNHNVADDDSNSESSLPASSDHNNNRDRHSKEPQEEAEIINLLAPP